MPRFSPADYISYGVYLRYIVHFIKVAGKYYRRFSTTNILYYIYLYVHTFLFFFFFSSFFLYIIASTNAYKIYREYPTAKERERVTSVGRKSNNKLLHAVISDLFFPQKLYGVDNIIFNYKHETRLTFQINNIMLNKIDKRFIINITIRLYD